MLKKTLLLGMILTSLLIGSAFSVSAVDETKTIFDDIDDVVDAEGKNVSIKPNVDITKIQYEQNGQTVTVILTVKGRIENRGTLADALASLGYTYDENQTVGLEMDFVFYVIVLSTSSNLYFIPYVNNECNISDDEGFITPKSWSAINNELKITFDLKDEDETFDSSNAITMDANIVGILGSLYGDEAPDFIELDASITGPSKAKVNETVRFIGKAVSEYSDFEWDWDFGDGSNSNEQNPSHRFEKPGKYTVKLYVVDGNYNEGYSSFTINISEATINDPIGNNVDRKFSIPPILIFIALIAIVATVGIAVVIYIIRKK